MKLGVDIVHIYVYHLYEIQLWVSSMSENIVIQILRFLHDKYMSIHIFVTYFYLNVLIASQHYKGPFPLLRSPHSLLD
jgi:hypothetical protein